MATRCLENVKQNLLCAICLDIYTSPRSLPCHHTFCLHCLTGHITKSNQSPIKCPTCRHQLNIRLPLSSNDVVASFYPLNTLLGSIADLIRLNELGLPQCEFHGKKNGEYFCFTDNIPLCPDCAISKHRTTNCEVLRTDEARSKLQTELSEMNKHYDDKAKDLRKMSTTDHKTNLSKDIKANTLKEIEEFEKQFGLLYAQVLQSTALLKSQLKTRRDFLPTNYEDTIRDMTGHVRERQKQLDKMGQRSDWFLKMKNIRSEKESFIANLDKDVKNFSASVFQANVKITDLFQQNVSGGTLTEKELSISLETLNTTGRPFPLLETRRRHLNNLEWDTTDVYNLA